ncbi:MAG: DsbA family protein [Acidimicrobiia bacterium]
MASSNKRRGPKPQPGAVSKRPAPSSSPRPPKGAPTRSRTGIAWQWWVVAGVFAAALVIGIVVQSSRSKTENTKVVTPKHALGPNHSELEGSSSAPVLVQEYADFQCPTCKRFHDVTGPTVDALVSQGKIRFAYTYYPFLGPESIDAASAAVCAGDQRKFFEYSDLLYTRQQSENSGFLTTDRLISFGGDAGITGAAFNRFEKCVRAKTYDGFVRKSADDASKRGVSGTPTVYITGPNGKTGELSIADALTPALFKQAVAQAAAQT